LPIYNELYVAGRLIDAVAAFDYPAGRLEIQVLDDSIDETTFDRGRACRPLACPRRGYPARTAAATRRLQSRALANGLATARGELIAIFDADFVPQPSFLRSVVPTLVADDASRSSRRAGATPTATTRWLTKLQALSIDGHFAVEQAGRWPAATGSTSTARPGSGGGPRSTMPAAGTRTRLTEDLDLSYRAMLRGWRAAFLRRLRCRGTACQFQCLPAPAASLGARFFRVRIPSTCRRSGTPGAAGEEGAGHAPSHRLRDPSAPVVDVAPVSLLLLVAPRYPQVLSLFGVMAVFKPDDPRADAAVHDGQRQLGRNWIREIPTVLMLSAMAPG